MKHNTQAHNMYLSILFTITLPLLIIIIDTIVLSRKSPYLLHKVRCGIRSVISAPVRGNGGF